MTDRSDRINIVDTIRAETASLPDRVAVTRKDRSVTIKELLEEVGHIRDLLARQYGIGKNSRTALLYADSIEYIILALAVLDLGAVMVPISPSLSLMEFDTLVERMRINHVISDRPVTSLVKAGELTGTAALYTTGCDVCPLDGQSAAEPAFIRFSSGTTGASKGVLLTHQAIIDRTDAADERLNITCDDTVAWFLSMSYHFVVTILLFLRRGARIALCGDDFPKGAAESFRIHPPTFLYASPFHYSFLTKSSDFQANMLSNARMAVSTAIALDRATAEAFKSKFGLTLSQAYGIIEVGLPFINHRTDDEYIDSVGRILPAYQLRLKDRDQNGRGRILLKGKGMFEAYVSPWQKRPEWFDTGDIGEVSNGYLFIRGRTKNVINFNGMKIFPEEVENVMNDFEGIREARVFARPHRLYGQLPAAEYTTSEDVDQIRISELREFLRNRLDIYKIPKEFIHTGEIPKTPSGKIKR
ncbi:MAG: class I adenylate-forming enzyme family protein [Desulfobacteraceae bacterium]